MMEGAAERLGERISVIGRIEEGSGMEDGHPHPNLPPSRGKGSPRASSRGKGLSRASRVRVLDSEGNEIETGAGGWDHFGGRHG